MVFAVRSEFCHGELYYERHIVGLIFGVQRHLVPSYLSALCASVNDNKSFFGIGLGADGLKLSTAGVCSVPGVYIHVERPKAMRTVVARGIAEGLHLLSAMHAYKGVIILCKSFLFHTYSPFI